MSGSELNLYEADEWSRVWWVAGHTAGRVSASLRGSMRGEHMLAQKLELMALSCMCYGAVMVSAESLRLSMCRRADKTRGRPTVHRARQVSACSQTR